MFRHPVTSWFFCSLYGNANLLAGHCVSAFRVVVLLVSSNVGNGHHFAYLSVASSRLALALSGQGREIGGFWSYLGQLVCAFSYRGA